MVAGLAAGAVVVPQAMAYATIAGQPVQVGLYTCMVPMVVYALLGGSRTLSVSTTSTIATLTASTLLAAGIAANSTDPKGDLAMLTVLVGVTLILVHGSLHLGVLVENISDAVVVGLKIGVGLTVAAGQLPKLLGIPADPDADTFFTEIRSAIDHLGDVSGTTLLLSAATIVTLLLLARFAPENPRAPGGRGRRHPARGDRQPRRPRRRAHRQGPGGSAPARRAARSTTSAR